MVVNCFSMIHKPKEFQGILNSNLCTAVAYEKYFYHVFITPHKSCIFSQMLDITGFFALCVLSESSPVWKIFSQIVSVFLMFFPVILVKTLVKQTALPTGNFKRLSLAAVHLWRHQTSHGCKCSVLRWYLHGPWCTAMSWGSFRILPY